MKTCNIYFVREMRMKKLILVRHAKAVSREVNLPDFRRTLVKKGMKNSENMADRLKMREMIPDLMISSPANRALETAHVFARALDYPVQKIVVNDILYSEMSPESLVQLIQKVEDKHESVMLFGHDPSFSDLASHLIKDFHEVIPKTGIVSIGFGKRNWKNIRKGDGQLIFFDYPKRISKAYKKMQMDLESGIARSIENRLKRVNKDSAQELDKMVLKSSRKIAREFVKIMKSLQVEEKAELLASEPSDKPAVTKAEPQKSSKRKAPGKQEKATKSVKASAAPQKSPSRPSKRKAKTQKSLAPPRQTKKRR